MYGVVMAETVSAPSNKIFLLLTGLETLLASKRALPSRTKKWIWQSGMPHVSDALLRWHSIASEVDPRYITFAANLQRAITQSHHAAIALSRN